MAPKRRNAGQWASKMLKKLGGIFVKILPAYHIARATSQTQTIKLQKEGRKDRSLPRPPILPSS